MKRVVSLSSSKSTVTPGTGVTFSGRVTKTKKGSAVLIERRTGPGAWKTVKTVRTTTASGSYRWSTPAPASAGTFSFRARVKASKGRRAAVSVPRALRVNWAKGSLQDPFAVGYAFILGDWVFRLGSTDTDAWPEIQAENEFNDAPASGWSYVTVPVTVTYRGAGFADPFWETNVRFLGSDGRVYSSMVGNQWCGVVPQSYLDIGELVTHGSATANACAVVPTAAIAGGTWRLSTDSSDDQYRFVRTR